MQSGWSTYCVSVDAKVSPFLFEFVAGMDLQPFAHGMHGPT